MSDIRKELKPCPFCGKEARAHQMSAMDNRVLCDRCLIGTHWNHEMATAIETWNTRAHDVDGLIAEIEKEEALLISPQRVISIIRKHGKE